MEKLNDSERKALGVILDTCDDLDGEHFTRFMDMVMALYDGLTNNGQVIGGYITSLHKKGYLDYEEDDGYGVGVWVNAQGVF